MKIVRNLSLVTLAMMAVSCSTIRKTATMVDVDAKIHNYPVVADLQIDKQKVSATVEWKDGFIRKKKVAEEKGNIVAELLKEKGGDVLLEPQFIHESEGILPRAFRKHKLVVSGFVGKYKDFHKATPEELKALEKTQGIAPNEATKLNADGGFFKFLK